MKYRKLGKSGLKLPVIAFGLWQNFDADTPIESIEEMVYYAYENGVTHFDLANNYGLPAGAAEERFGEVLQRGFDKHRDEIIISTKAGYHMWDGPYGDGGSRKYLFASLNQSLKRMGIEYVDIFYHHRWDDETDLRETMIALRDIVLQGKALYVGLSNYDEQQLARAIEMLEDMNVPYVVAQNRYNMLEREIEDGALKTVKRTDTGMVAYSPIAQGKLTDKYIGGIPTDSRAANEKSIFLNEKQITEELVGKLKKLDIIAKENNLTVVELALLWALRDESITSLICGFRTLEQLKQNLNIVNMDMLDENVIAKIEEALK